MPIASEYMMRKGIMATAVVKVDTSWQLGSKEVGGRGGTKVSSRE